MEEGEGGGDGGEEREKNGEEGRGRERKGHRGRESSLGLTAVATAKNT